MKETTSHAVHEEPIRIRKANDYIEELKHAKPPELLFDEFWRTGELALVFGSSGAGKSILAVQIAEAIARGRAIDGFRMPELGRRVLYVDMEMSHAHFIQRNSTGAAVCDRVKTHKFSDRFYREAPPDVDKLAQWLKQLVKEKSIQVAVIDSLAAVRKTQDGVRETLALMRELRRLKDELGISIMVVTDCAEARRGKTLAEADMGRNRTLCSVADSVFAICRHRTHFDHRYIVQTRSRNAPVVWTAENAPLCSIDREDSGLLAFRFDELYESRLGPMDLDLICNLKVARDEGGETYRSAAELFGISRSRAERLYKKWSPAIEARYRELVNAIRKQDAQDRQDENAKMSAQAETRAVASVPDEAIQRGIASRSTKALTDVRATDTMEEPDEFEEAGIERPVWLEVEANGELIIDNGKLESSEQLTVNSEQCEDNTIGDGEPIINSQLSTINYSAIPFAAGLRRRTIYDLTHALDEYGKDIYIEKVREYDGRPEVYYQFDNLGVLIKKVRNWLGTTGTRLGQGPYLE